MENNTECEITQDLLLGYVDNTLNPSSKQFVENHLKECKSCQERLEIINSDINKNEKKQKKEIDFLKNINHKINNKNKLIVISSIALIIIVIFNILVFINYYTQIPEIEIFLDPKISNEDKTNVENVIKKYESDIETTFISSKDALQKEQEAFSEYNLTISEDNANTFPSSYKITADKDIIIELQDIFSKMSGIKSIKTYIDQNPYELFIINVLENK